MVEDLVGRIAAPATKVRFYWVNFPCFAWSQFPIFLFLFCIPLFLQGASGLLKCSESGSSDSRGFNRYRSNLVVGFRTRFARQPGLTARCKLQSSATNERRLPTQKWGTNQCLWLQFVQRFQLQRVDSLLQMFSNGFKWERSKADRPGLMPPNANLRARPSSGA